MTPDVFRDVDASDGRRFQILSETDFFCDESNPLDRSPKVEASGAPPARVLLHFERQVLVRRSPVVGLRGLRQDPKAELGMAEPVVELQAIGGVAAVQLEYRTQQNGRVHCEAEHRLDEIIYADEKI